jgi:hypothetical protein
MSALALERAYPSIFGAPVLSRVDPAIFQLRYFRHCMACGFCSDQCCDHGVDIDVENVRRLEALGPEFAAFVGSEPARWFTGEIVADAEFPGGAHRRTRREDGHCIFRARNGRGCRIHGFCLEKGLDYRSLKPLVSILFPVTFEHGVLMASTELSDGTLVCGGQGDTLYEGARDELAHFFGTGLIAELDALAARL